MGAFSVSAEVFNGSSGAPLADTVLEAEFNRIAVCRNVRACSVAGDANRRRFLVGRTVGRNLAPHAAAKAVRSLVEQAAHRCGVGMIVVWVLVGELKLVQRRKSEDAAKPGNPPTGHGGPTTIPRYVCTAS
jgi:hypothetical protein